MREGVPKSNGIWEKRIQVVITSGVRDKILCLDLNNKWINANKWPFKWNVVEHFGKKNGKHVIDVLEKHMPDDIYKREENAHN